MIGEPRSGPGRAVPLTIGELVSRARTLHADRTGVVDEPGGPGGLGSLTYGELLLRVDGMIAALDRLGIAPGERVAVISPNATKLLIALYATTVSGRVLVPINHRLGADEARYVVADCDAALLLVDAELDGRFARVDAPRRIRLDGEQDAELFAVADAPSEWQEIAEDAPATINYTSGTTAAPKGVVLTHRSHWLNAVSVGWGLGLVPGDAYLHTLPTFHVNGWGLPLACAALGVPQVVQREVRGPEILRRVDAHGITLLCGAAPVVATIEQAARELRDARRSVPGDGRTRMVSGGAPTPPAVIERFERTTGWEMIHAYGLTETGPVLTVNRVPPTTEADPARRATRLAAAGTPLVGVRLRLDEHDQVLARTAKGTAGYWRAPERTDEAFADGWFATGDQGELSDDGVLRITDRQKDVIVSGGENVSSLAVEEVLLRHPLIADAAVIAVAHERWGETPLALVVPRDDERIEPAEVIAFCRERLAGFQCPTAVEPVTALPRTATGKLRKHLLRERYGR